MKKLRYIPLYYHGERFPNKTKSAFNLFIKLFMARITYNMHRVIKCRSHTGKLEALGGGLISNVIALHYLHLCTTENMHACLFALLAK